jgi:hypothetical protein
MASSSLYQKKAIYEYYSLFFSFLEFLIMWRKKESNNATNDRISHMNLQLNFFVEAQFGSKEAQKKKFSLGCVDRANKVNSIIFPFLEERGEIIMHNHKTKLHGSAY